MHRLSILFFIAFTLLFNRETVAQSGWINHTTCGYDHLEGIDKFTSSVWTAVGNSGAIYSTINSGVSWTAQNATTQMPLHDICVAAGNTAFIVGDSGIVLKTTNAGTTWTRQTSGTIMPLRAIYFQNASDGYACGWAGNMIKTTNGGTSWSIQTVSLSANFDDIYFASLTTGYSVGLNGIIYKTSDAGNTWQQQISGVTNNLHKVFFLDTLNGFCAGSSGLLLHTVDGGANWNPVTPFTADNLLSVCFPSAALGFCSSDGGQIYSSTNGGLNWSVMTSMSYEANDIIALSSTKAIAACKLGNVQESVFFDWFQLPITASCEQTSFVNDTVGYAFSNVNSTILKTTDGINWTVIDTLINQIADIEFINDSVGFLSRNQSLYCTTDGGANWVIRTTTLGLGKIKFFSADTGMCSAGLSFTTDGGQSWISRPNSGSANDYHFFDLDTGYCVSPSLKFTKDGGNNWQILLTGSFDRVFFTNKNVGFVWNVTTPVLYKTTDGGRNFQQLTLPFTGGNLKDVLFVDSLTGYITTHTSSYYVYLYKTTDGGNTWVSQSCGYQGGNTLRLDFPDKNHGYCVTYGGIMKNINFDVTIGNNPPYQADPFIRQPSPPYAWTMQPGDTPSFQNVNDSRNALITSTAVDDENKIIIGGAFFDKCRIDTFQLDSPYDQQAIFIAKTDELKNFEWVIPFYISGTSTNPTKITSIECDQFHNIYVGGVFGGTLTIGSTVMYASIPGNFIVKLDSAGTVLWTFSCLPHVTPNDHSFHISVNTFGYLVMTGNYNTSLIVAMQTLLNSQGKCFIGKFDFNGNLDWLIQSTDSLSTKGVSCDFSPDGNIVVCGTYYHSCKFDNTVLNTIDSTDIFLAKFDDFDGSLLWLEGVYSNGNDYPTDVVCDMSNNIFLTGIYDGICRLDTITWLLNSSSRGVFYGKFSNVGSLLWVNKIQAAKSAAMTVSVTGNCYLTGSITIPTYFADTLFSPASPSKIFTLKTDVAGKILWANSIDCPVSLSTQENTASDVAVSNTGNCYITGNVWGYDISQNGMCSVSTGTTTNAAQYGYLAKIGYNSTTSIPENVSTNNMALFPVPANDLLYYNVIDLPETAEVILYDIAGREVAREKIQGTASNAINVSALNPGSYFIRITGENFSHARAFVISR